MNNNIIIHKIILYLNDSRKAKIFFYLNDYRSLINSSNSHFDELYTIYGIKDPYFIRKLKYLQSLYRLKLLPAMIQTNKKLSHKKNIIDFFSYLGNLDIINFLFHNQIGIFTADAFYNAVEVGHLHILKFYHEMFIHQYEQISNNTWLQNIYSNIDTSDEHIIYLAASNGHLNIIQYINEICEAFPYISQNTINQTAANGHFEILKYFGKIIISPKYVFWYRGYTYFTEKTMRLAAKNGHFEIVKWLESNRIDFNLIYSENSITGPARNGYFHIVKFLNDNYNNSSNLGYQDCLFNIKDILNNAILGNHLEIVIWVHQIISNNFLTIDLTDKSIVKNSYRNFYHCHNTNNIYYKKDKKHGLVPFDDILFAAKHKRFQIVKWLYINNREWYTNETIQVTINYCDSTTASWLIYKEKNWKPSNIQQNTKNLFCSIQ